MKAAFWVAGLVLLNGCAPFRSDPTGCEAAADRDPDVSRFQAIAASSPQYIRDHEEDFKIARASALRKCQQQRGIVAPGGGVEPYRRPK